MKNNTTKSPQGFHEPFAIDSVPKIDFTKGTKYAIEYQDLSHFGGGNKVGVSLEVLKMGKQAYPTHYHMLEEEHLMILEGELTLTLGDQTYIMRAGDHVCFPAGQKAGHSVFNHNDADCCYLIIGENNPNDVVVYTTSNKVSVRVLDERYDKVSKDYWDGESLD